MSKSAFSIKNMSNELKIAYVLIILIIAFIVFCKFTKCSKNKESNVKDEISQWVKDNPKEILDSINGFLEQQRANAQRQQETNAKEAIKTNYDKLTDEKTAGIYNSKGKKIIVEFFDYNCGYCKMAKQAIDQVVKEDKDVKVIYRDFPIFGGNSEVAAKYAIAVAISNPDKYHDFASALFELGAREEATIKDAVVKAGLKLANIEKVLKNKESEINDRLKANRELATSLGLRGTPAFVIGEEFVPGYVDATTIKSMLNK